MAEGEQIISRVVDSQEAARIIRTLRETEGFHQAEDPVPQVGNTRTREFANELGDRVTIGPLLPRESGKRIILSTQGVEPIIKDVIKGK